MIFQFSEVILLGNSLIFLIAGYDSTGLTLSYSFWHLGGNSIEKIGLEKTP